MMRAETPCAQEETGRRLSTVKMCLSHFPLSNLDCGSGYRLWHTHRHTQSLQPATDAQLTSQSITKGEKHVCSANCTSFVCVRARALRAGPSLHHMNTLHPSTSICVCFLLFLLSVCYTARRLPPTFDLMKVSAFLFFPPT